MGKPRGIRALADHQLHEAMNKISVLKAKRKDGMNYFLEFLIKRAYASDNVLVALSKKILPDKVQNENIGTTDIYNIINQIRASIPEDNKASVGMDRGDGVDEGRTRFEVSDKEVPE